MVNGIATSEISSTALNFLIFLFNFCPVWALLITQTRLKGKKWLVITIPCLISSSFFFLFFFYNQWWGSKSNVVFSLYLIEIAVLILLFSKKFSLKNFSKVLALSLLVVFVLSEFHEYANFVLYDYINLQAPSNPFYEKAPIILRVMSNVYTLFAFLFTIKLSNLKLDRRLPIICFLVSLGIPVITVTNYDPIIDLAKRILVFLLWASMFYLGSRRKSE